MIIRSILSISKTLYSSVLFSKIEYHNHLRQFSKDSKSDNFLRYHISENSNISQEYYENICQKTLDKLNDDFEKIGETCDVSREYDVVYTSGILNVQFGKEVGTYVINKQSANKQIWLSSPISGPKRFDLMTSKWIYRSEDLHELLTKEISFILKKKYIFEF